MGEARGQAASRASAALAAAARPVPEIQGGAHAGALDAVRDVIGWNTVWDPINRRPYTSLSRNWVSQKFGGFGVWLDDIFYHALMAGLFDAEVARENLRAIYAGATAAGNLPCLVTGRDSWIDRTQPPIGSFICWMLHKRLGSRDLLQEAWPVLLANHDWWWRDARRQWRRAGGIWHLARGRRTLSRHQARGEGRVQHGQFAHP